MVGEGKRGNDRKLGARSWGHFTILPGLGALKVAFSNSLSCWQNGERAEGGLAEARPFWFVYQQHSPPGLWPSSGSLWPSSIYLLCWPDHTDGPWRPGTTHSSLWLSPVLLPDPRALCPQGANGQSGSKPNAITGWTQADSFIGTTSEDLSWGNPNCSVVGQPQNSSPFDGVFAVIVNVYEEYLLMLRKHFTHFTVLSQRYCIMLSENKESIQN